MRSKSIRVLYIVTHPMTARYLLRGQLAWMRERGFEVAVACAPGPDLDAVREHENVVIFPVPIPREIKLFADCLALRALCRLMSHWRPDIVYAATPKAGLIGMVAAWIKKVPVRIYGQWGLRLETKKGASRVVLATAERIAAACAHRVIAVSTSLLARFVALRLAPAEKVTILGDGTANGVRFERFAYPDGAAVEALRERLKLPEHLPVIGFVGRFTRDKGIADLVDAFEHVRARVPEAHLLLVGDFEAGDAVPETVVEYIRSHPAIVKSGFLEDAAPAYALMDVLAFPSYREGFPNVPLEAAAAGLPVVGFRATGTVDAVVDEVTGMLVDVGDIEGLAAALTRYLTDDSLRMTHGNAGQRRASVEFAPERVWHRLLEEYKRLLQAAGRPIPINIDHPAEVS